MATEAEWNIDGKLSGKNWVIDKDLKGCDRFRGTCLKQDVKDVTTEVAHTGMEP